MKKGRKWYKSRVIWFNAASGGAAFAAGAWMGVADHMHPWLGWGVGIFISAVNVGLRFITTDPITSKAMDDRVDEP